MDTKLTFLPTQLKITMEYYDTQLKMLIPIGGYLSKIHKFLSGAMSLFELLKSQF